MFTVSFDTSNCTPSRDRSHVGGPGLSRVGTGLQRVWQWPIFWYANLQVRGHFLGFGGITGLHNSYPELKGTWPTWPWEAQQCRQVGVQGREHGRECRRLKVGVVDISPTNWFRAPINACASEDTTSHISHTLSLLWQLVTSYALLVHLSSYNQLHCTFTNRMSTIVFQPNIRTHTWHTTHHSMIGWNMDV